MEKIVKQIERIKLINANNNLVIFVGAGVSKNSGVCSWWELVKEIADRIGKNKCAACKMKKNLKCVKCGKKFEYCVDHIDDCELKYDFSGEDFLRIPQYYYESLGNSNEEKQPYYDFLKEKFCKINYESNSIDEIIIRLQPEHIITSNYDHLLDNVNDPRVSNYALITKDEDILAKKGRNYIIKMHGDIDDIENIVLKEEDYLNYSQKHIIIETFIKSLLIDKTFLFVGYSLNDNNLKLIMSYIDYFVKEKKIENRQPHYLVVNQINDSSYDIPYWKNKGVELVDLSEITDFMINNSKCENIENDVGKRLYTFLNYLSTETLAYTNDPVQLNITLEKFKENVSCFKFISHKTIMEMFRFKSVSEITPVLTFSDQNEYSNFKVLINNKDLRELLMKSGIYGIQLGNTNENDRILFQKVIQDENDLFNLSLQNKYYEIIDRIDNLPVSLEKAYYYSLIKYRNGLYDIYEDLKKQFESIDYLHLSNQQYYELAIYEFNNTCIRLLSYTQNDRDIFNKLNLLLDSAAARYSNAYNTIKEITNKGADIQKMNNYLFLHEEYYMKKSTMLKIGGTNYGDLFKIRQIVYDYYFFYKKNYLMLDWFNNVEKMVTPYIKAIFCTYYPDEFQTDPIGLFSRTNVNPYPIELVDLDMIVKHIKIKNLKSIASHYKVDSIEISNKIDISLLFENFCLSMKKYYHLRMEEQLESFCFILSLCKLSKEQNKKIVKSFILLLGLIQNKNFELTAKIIHVLHIYVEKHFDKTIFEYNKLLVLLINAGILKVSGVNFYEYCNLVSILSEIADERIYKICCVEISKLSDFAQKVSFVFSNRMILLKYDCCEWINWIETNISDFEEREVFQFLYEKTLTFNEKVKRFYVNQFKTYGKNNINGVLTIPDHRAKTINDLIVLVLLDYATEEDVSFMKEYMYLSDYLEFIFEPESFDYEKVKISDKMWCNFINSTKYRKKLLKQKDKFWNKDEEKRIELGFGSPFENRTAYKYLFE